MTCPDCGEESLQSDVCGQYCTECDWDYRTTPDVPEGGWPRGSDMDKI